jgi:hypothetical protein
MVTKARIEELKRRCERRRQPSRWGNNEMRICGVQLEDGSPTSGLPCKKLVTCSGEITATQKNCGIYWTDVMVILSYEYSDHISSSIKGGEFVVELSAY